MPPARRDGHPAHVRAARAASAGRPVRPHRRRRRRGGRGARDAGRDHLLPRPPARGLRRGGTRGAPSGERRGDAAGAGGTGGVLGKRGPDARAAGVAALPHLPGGTGDAAGAAPSRHPARGRLQLGRVAARAARRDGARAARRRRGRLRRGRLRQAGQRHLRPRAGAGGRGARGGVARRGLARGRRRGRDGRGHPARARRPRRSAQGAQRGGDRRPGRPTLPVRVTSVPPPSGSEPLLRPELPDGLPPERIPPLPPPPSRADGLPAWPPWAPFAAMLVTLGIAILGATLATFVAQLSGHDVSAGDPPPGVTITGTFFQDGALILSAWLLARLTAGNPTPSQFGLRLVAPMRALGWLLLTWLVFIVFSGIWAAALGIEENDDLPQELGADDSSTALFFVALLVCVAAPIAEELFFRGFCFTALRRWIGLVPGAIATGAIFGLIHAGSADAVFLVPLAVFGVLLCALYYKTGSLLPSMVLHALNNSLALGVSQSWGVLEIAALMLGASGVVLAIVLPFARRTPQTA